MTEINTKNIDRVISDAIDHYYEIGLIQDALFWKHCISVLKKKYEENI